MSQELVTRRGRLDQQALFNNVVVLDITDLDDLLTVNPAHCRVEVVFRSATALHHLLKAILGQILDISRI